MQKWLENILEAFRDTGYVALMTFLMSLAALFVAILAWYSSRRTSIRLVEIEEQRDRLASKQSAKASLRAAVINTAKNTYNLSVQNQGSAEAKNIVITLDGKPFLNHPVIAGGQEEKRQLGASSSHKYRLAQSLSNPLPKHIRIEWADGSGEDGMYETSL